jgi:hypothetical protein
MATGPNATPQAQKPDGFAYATLALCVASYLPKLSSIPPAVAKAPPLTTGGQWKCIWGPAQNSDEANLAFVAGYSPKGATTPQYICVTLRGTDVDVHDIWGKFEQIYEDLDAPFQSPMPWAPNDPSRIADGSLEALTIIQNLTSGGRTLAKYLQSFFADPAHAGVKCLVTGHSLGGCLTTLVAPWMLDLLAGYKGTIQPITFAAPTAGDANFAMYYDSKFPLARRYQNSLDVIPLGFGSLGSIDSIYDKYGLYVPDPVWLGLLAMEEAMRATSASYVQPTNGTQYMPGYFLLNDKDDWYAQALHQHHLATYKALLDNTTVDEAALPPSTSTRSKKATFIKRIGSVDGTLKKLLGN